MPAPVSAIALPPGVRTPETADERRLLEQARSFETLLLSLLTRELTASAGLAGDGAGTSSLHGQLVADALAEGLSTSGGIGIAGLVYGQLAGRPETP